MGTGRIPTRIRTTPTMSRCMRSRFAAAIATLCLAFSPLASAEGAGDFPSKPMRVIVPYPPGGGADLVARLVGQHLGERLKQPVMVENRGGASNTIGMRAVATSPKDGYTLGLATPVFVMTPALMKDHPYDPLKDFAPVAMTGFTPLVLVVHPSVPAKNTQELIALARSKPGTLSFASLGSATTQGLAAAMFNSMTGIAAVEVPYKGSAPGVTDLLSGNVQYMFNALPSMIPHVQAGKLRGLGVTGARRSPLFPDLPAIEEAVPGYQITTWYSFVAPAGTPKGVVELLNREISAIVNLPTVQERMKTAGLEPNAMSTEALGSLFKSESAKWAKVITDAKVQPE
jgi:tripartite-type tricarboxylate transporter receptor subunit TctC